MNRGIASRTLSRQRHSAPQIAFNQSALRNQTVTRPNCSYNDEIAECSNNNGQTNGLSRRHMGLIIGATSLSTLAANSAVQAAVSTQDLIQDGKDVYYPEFFLGRWKVKSLLENVTMPLGEDYVSDMKVVQRAIQQDVGKVSQYDIAFVRNHQGRIVADRKFNTQQILSQYLGDSVLGEDIIKWDVTQPDQMAINYGGMLVVSQVTKRAEQMQEQNKLEVTESFQQLFNKQNDNVKIKASQQYTKYKWRDLVDANNGVSLVAQQVVSDYPDDKLPVDKLVSSKGQPVVQYFYKMQFQRA